MVRKRNSSLVDVAASLKRHRRVPDATTKELLSKVAQLRAEGKNWREVGAALGREHTTIFRTVKRWPLEYDRALRKLKRPIDRRAERLASRLEREEVYRRLELLRLDRAAGRAIDAALEDPKIGIKLRAAEAYMNYLNRELPERIVSLHSSEPVADDKQSDSKRVTPQREAAAQLDDDFTDLLARDRWLTECLAPLGPDNLTDEAIMQAVLDKCANEPEENR